ncbi:MAG: hypothetical protein HY291_05505 [Planctomycetes bacterium]|nr:hypothetical protein [Planctomycetota bacterium]
MTIEKRNDRWSERNGKFWPTLALCALLLCGWMAVSKGGAEVRADNGGATTAGIIAMMGINSNNERLYLIDTSTKTILVYETGPNDQTKLVSSRSYDVDFKMVEKASYCYTPYNGKGYEKEVKDFITTLPPKQK